MNQDAARKNELWDFSQQFITPAVRRHLPNPVRGTALDISCGEGRRVESAAGLFGRAIGVDVAEMLQLPTRPSSWSPNVEFIVRENAQLPVESGSIDYVFTLRGLTWFDTIDQFDDEIAEVARILKPGGITMLWFGRITRLPFAMSPLELFRGYSHNGDEIVPLRVRQTRVRKSLRKAGLRHVALSTPLHPDTSWRLFRGGDLSYVTAVKRS